jgi:hypothetical protein
MMGEAVADASELRPQLNVGSAFTSRGERPMKKYVIGTALLVAFTAPALATSSTTTTTTTGGSTTSTTEQYFVVRDPSTKKCTVTTSKPSSGTTVVVGDTVYKSRTEAESAVTKVCTQ